MFCGVCSAAEPPGRCADAFRTNLLLATSDAFTAPNAVEFAAGAIGSAR